MLGRPRRDVRREGGRDGSRCGFRRLPLHIPGAGFVNTKFTDLRAQPLVRLPVAGLSRDARKSTNIPVDACGISAVTGAVDRTQAEFVQQLLAVQVRLKAYLRSLPPIRNGPSTAAP